MVQTHLYARNAETPVFGSPFEGALPITLLHKGSWMGMLEDNGKWVRVITINGEGWVEREYTEERTPGELHILLMEDQTVEYVNSESSVR